MDTGKRCCQKYPWCECAPMSGTTAKDKQATRDYIDQQITDGIPITPGGDLVKAQVAQIDRERRAANAKARKERESEPKMTRTKF